MSSQVNLILFEQRSKAEYPPLQFLSTCDKQIQMKSFQPHQMRFAANQKKILIPSYSNKRLLVEETQPQQEQQKCLTLLNLINLENQCRHYDWRLKTEFPIVKILRFKVIRKLENGKAELEVVHQSYPARLAHLKDIPLIKAVYLLKESLIGYQRVTDRFGFFHITDKMIAINSQHKCKIWLNENFALNELKQVKIQEREFVLSILKIVEQKCIKSKNTAAFFEELSKSKSFCAALGFIQNYVKQNKMNIPTFFRVNARELNPIQTKGQYDPTMTMSRAPKFLSPNHHFLPRATLNNQTGNELFISIPKKQTEAKRLPPDQLKLKKSGDTAPDLFTSNTLTHTDGYSSGEIPSPTKSEKCTPSINIFKSELPIKLQTSLQFQRKLSINSMLNNQHLHPQHQHQLHKSNDKTLNIQSITFDNSGQIQKNKINQQSHSSESDDEGQQEHIGNLFVQNKWEKKIEGLFSDGSAMKKSIHHGKTQSKNTNNHEHLLLLGKIGKPIFQSVMEDHYS